MRVAPIRFFSRPPTPGLVDRFGRRQSYMRISVTDRCNMRCDYCRPAAGDWRSEARERLLSFEEIARIARVATELGVTKIRLTGGEPLVRRDLPRLVGMLVGLGRIRDLAMTTNGALLARHARALADAGLMRVNVSLDSLNSLRFQRLTGGELSGVLRGIEAARRVGLEPIKINCVLMRGVNDDEAPALMDFAAREGLTLRFIELMPMKRGLDWNRRYLGIDQLLRRDEVRMRLAGKRPLAGSQDVARYWAMRNGGMVGFITPMSARFCEGCNRLRLTADGGLRSCLPADGQLNLRDLLRGGCTDDEIRAVFLRAALIKPEIGIYEFDAGAEKRSMIQIGG